MSQYRNRPTTLYGIQFDSGKEAQRYLELRDKERRREISALMVHPRYELIPAGNGERAVTYTVDFAYTENGRCVVEDIKSEATRKDKTHIIKRKLFKQENSDIQFREVVYGENGAIRIL